MKILNLFFLIIFFAKVSLSNEFINTNEYQLNFSSDNIKEEKENKINEIKIKSIKKIFAKILTENNFNKINFNDINFVNLFILNYKIKNEKIIKNNYYSNVKINFNEKLIINYLVSNKIKFTDKVPEKFLILILEQDNLQNHLLTKDNNFYNYLINSKERSFINNYIIPKLDYNDRFIFNKNHFINNDFFHNDLLNLKYKTNYQILVHAVKNENQIVSSIFLYVNNQKFFLKNIKTYNNDYKNLFNQILKTSTDKWKELNQIDTSQRNILECDLNISNIHELGYVRKLLKSNKLIEKLDLKSIALNKNKYQILYFGNFDTFKQSLQKIRLNLFFYNNICNIELI